MLVMKCSRLLRFGSRLSVKLLKAVIGIGLFKRSIIEVSLLFLPEWHRQVGIPDISTTLPLPVGLLFPNLDVLAAVLHRLTAGISRHFFVGAAHAGEISGLRYFNLGCLPTDGRARTREKILQDIFNHLLCPCRRSVRSSTTSSSGCPWLPQLRTIGRQRREEPAR